ncbi:MAG: ATP phosphoribosyltransferase regulatory subunit, partial [Leadbetterella sp.]|nr:ATP phosphoribosyltransferase regulatory subunit [Leadbetterella sp.]
MHFRLFLAGIIAFVAVSCNTVSKKEYHDPEKLWGELYHDVTEARLFSNPKEFWDAAPKGKADKLLPFYLEAKTGPGFDLSEFVAAYFTVPDYSRAWPASPDNFETYVANSFRDLLTRPKDDGGSLVPTRMRYLSGGGMFPEYNYYRSFFAVKAFQALGEDSLAADIATNAFQFIQDYGYVPYGNRSYYLGFSGFPVLSLMAEAVAETHPALLPNGLSDLVPPFAEAEQDAVNRLLACYAGFGYQLVKPPLMEFEAGLLRGPGAALAPQTFRLMD